MFCTNCGFENPAMHRFCGMCGTPLPQRPITAPGAQSTADLTRHPVGVTQTTPSSASHSGATVVQVSDSGTSGSTYFSQVEQADSLEQFIAGFRYTPPVEEDEVTMTGDRPVLDDTTKYEPAAPISVSEGQSLVAEPLLPAVESLPLSTAAVDDTPEQPAVVVTEPPPFATKGVREKTPERSRFLDFSEQEKEQDRVPAPTTSSIGGPSFLGLSDTPASPAYVGEANAERQSHWRAWTAVVVLLIFGALGALEWRAEKNQSSNGPIGIMRMQIDRLKGKKAVITPASETAPEPAQPGSTSQPSGSGPEMQVAPRQKPQPNPPQPVNNNASPEKPTNPGAASTAPASAPAVAEAKSTPVEKSSVPENAHGADQKPEIAMNAESEKFPASSTNETAESKAEKPAKTTPGADELAKAANASDREAASAWLWKSVAKGNPDAPVKLANMYIKGDGVPQSCDQAVVLLRSAAAKENAPARSRLGSLYATGTCVQRNRVRAYEYMSQALEANPNAAGARDAKQQLWAQMTTQERQQVQKSQ